MSTTDCSVPEKIVGLTPMQVKLYDQLRLNNGPVPAKHLSEPVLGREFLGDFSAITCHVYRLRPMLQRHGLTIQRVGRKGYVLATHRPSPETQPPQRISQ